MKPEHEVVHLRHDIRSLEAALHAKLRQVDTLLDIALEALSVDRPHVAVEKINTAKLYISNEVSAPRYYKA